MAAQQDGREVGRRQRWSIGMGDNSGGQWLCVGASEAAECGWWWWGRLAKQGGGEGNVFFRICHVLGALRSGGKVFSQSFFC